MKGISISNAWNIHEVILSTEEISFEEFIAVVKYGAKLSFSEQYKENIILCRQTVEQFLEDGKILYGITTGFGDNVRYTIAPDDAIQLQKNILRSHAVSVGSPLSLEETRAVILMIILNTGKGYSGIQLETLELLCMLLNNNYYPYAPGEGSVGYLSIEAHICLTLIGEGYFIEQGQRISGKEFFQKHHISPVRLGCKEGLALISGTTSATAFALLALFYGLFAEKQLEIINGLVFESLRATPKALVPEIHHLKKHPHQQMAANTLAILLKESAICKTYYDAKVQDACLLRSMPQMIGSCKLLLEEAYHVFCAELHSVSDNPVIFSQKEGAAYMTGNFDGTYIATHCDLLCIAFAKLGNIMERSTDRMVNHHISNGLPPFLTEKPGLNSGLMIPQYTQAGLLNKMKILATPASIDSITTCAGQEDPVSMAYNAAQKAYKSSQLLFDMTAIELMTAIQAVELTVKNTGLSQSPILNQVRNEARLQIPFLEEDRYLYQDITSCRNLLASGKMLTAVESFLEYDI